MKQQPVTSQVYGQQDKRSKVQTQNYVQRLQSSYRTEGRPRVKRTNLRHCLDTTSPILRASTIRLRRRMRTSRLYLHTRSSQSYYRGRSLLRRGQTSVKASRNRRSRSASPNGHTILDKVRCGRYGTTSLGIVRGQSFKLPLAVFRFSRYRAQVGGIIV